MKPGCTHPPLSDRQRLDLAAEMFELAYRSAESFAVNYVGCDLTYLMNAIITDKEYLSFVDWSYDLEPGKARYQVHLPHIIKANCPPNHPVWLFILTDNK